MSPKSKLGLLAILFVSLLAIAVYVGTDTYSPVQSTVPPAVLGSGRAGPDSAYPPKDLTPGTVFETVTESEICTPGYTKTVRDVSTSVKKQIYQTYGISYPQEKGAYEVDHFIPLELGGNNDIKNLWLEPAYPSPGFREKDRVENYLHDKVCKGEMTLTQAQQQIQSDWYAVYVSIGK